MSREIPEQSRAVNLSTTCGAGSGYQRRSRNPRLLTRSLFAGGIQQVFRVGCFCPFLERNRLLLLCNFDGFAERSFGIKARMAYDTISRRQTED